MGAPMALNLVKAGHSLKVYDLAPAAVKTLTDAGAKAAASAADAVQGAEVVISMLPASKHVEGLYLGEDLLGKIPASALVIECSTIAPDSARKVAQAAEARGIAMIDAPCRAALAARPPARSPSSSAVARRAGARPSGAGKMGKNIFHAGAAGAGQVAKICNNMLLGILMAGTPRRWRWAWPMAWIPRCCRTSSPRARAATGPPNSTTPGPA